MDIGRALTYFTEDERWVEKTAIGTGLLLVSTLLSVVLVGVLGYFILFGYMVRLLQNVRDGVHPALPEWNQWGDDLVRGVKVACVYIVWALPVIFVSVPLSIFGWILEDSFRYSGDVAWLFLACSFCLTFLVAIAYVVLQPGFTIAFARNEVISDGLQASEIWEWTRDNIGNVVIVAILTVIASVIITTVGSIIGTILCVVGLVVTVPLSQLVTYYVQSHLYGQLASLAGDGTGGGAFGPMPPAGRAPEDGAAPVTSVPPVVYDAEEEAEPEEDGEPEDGTGPEDSAEPEDGTGPEDSAEPEDGAEPEDSNEPEDGTEPAEGPVPMEDSEPAEEPEEVEDEVEPAQEEGSAGEDRSDEERPPEEPKSQ